MLKLYYLTLLRRLGFARLKDYISEQPSRIAGLRCSRGIRHALAGRFILDERFEVVGELRALDVGVGHEEGRARFHACAGVYGLVIFGGDVAPARLTMASAAAMARPI